MAEEYHNITTEEYPDIQIPGRLFELRDLIDDPDLSQVYMFGTTSYRGNFGNPCFCLGPADVDFKQIDVGGLIEENLQAFCDYGTAEDVRQILGLVQEDELSESRLECEEFSYVDKGWCIDGLVESFERIDMPEEKEQSISFDRDLIEKGLQQGIIEVYPEDEVDSRVEIGDYGFWVRTASSESGVVDSIISALEDFAMYPWDHADELAYYAAYLQENVDCSEVADAPVSFSQVYLQMYEDENEVARIYAFDYRKEDLVWKAVFKDPAAALGVWKDCCKSCNTTLPLPDVESLSDNNICRGADVFSWCIADTREITEKNPYGIDFTNYKQKGSVLFVGDEHSYEDFAREKYGAEIDKKDSLMSLSDRCNGAKEASKGLDNHDTEDEQRHDMDKR